MSCTLALSWSIDWQHLLNFLMNLVGHLHSWSFLQFPPSHSTFCCTSSNRVPSKDVSNSVSLPASDHINETSFFICYLMHFFIRFPLNLANNEVFHPFPHLECLSFLPVCCPYCRNFWPIDDDEPYQSFDYMFPCRDLFSTVLTVSWSLLFPHFSLVGFLQHIKNINMSTHTGKIAEW